MADQNEIGNLTYELLKRMSARFDRFELELMDVKRRLSSLDDHVSGVGISLTGLTTRMDRVESRLDRIERRLDLVGVD